MTLQERVCAELSQRLAVLPEETAGWLRRAMDARGNWGIHRSQLLALRATMNVLHKKQDDKLRQLEQFQPGTDPAGFARLYSSLSREMVAVAELWRVFRSLLDQRERQLQPAAPAGGWL